MKRNLTLGVVEEDDPIPKIVQSQQVINTDIIEESKEVEVK